MLFEFTDADVFLLSIQATIYNLSRRVKGPFGNWKRIFPFYCYVPLNDEQHDFKQRMFVFIKLVCWCVFILLIATHSQSQLVMYERLIKISLASLINIYFKIFKHVLKHTGYPSSMCSLLPGSLSNACLTLWNSQIQGEFRSKHC